MRIGRNNGWEYSPSKGGCLSITISNQKGKLIRKVIIWLKPQPRPITTLKVRTFPSLKVEKVSQNGFPVRAYILLKRHILLASTVWVRGTLSSIIFFKRLKHIECLRVKEGHHRNHLWSRFVSGSSLRWVITINNLTNFLKQYVKNLFK